MKIGVFDSGVGGLWILKHLKEKLPMCNFVYFGDQRHVPYGNKSKEEIIEFSEKITEFLKNKDCKIIVIACNTASAVALKYLRGKFPETIFVGMEPAVKPASEITKTKKIGILATPATFKGELYNSTVDKYANEVEIFEDTCDWLVSEIEKGNLDGKETRMILERALYPMLKSGVDTVVLGCTHYPFVTSEIRKIVGENVKIIDPTGAIVVRVEKIIEEINGGQDFPKDSRKILPAESTIEIFTSGKKEQMNPILSKLFEEKPKVEEINWTDDL